MRSQATRKLMTRSRGNICRCGTYQRIREAVHLAAKFAGRSAKNPRAWKVSAHRTSAERAAKWKSEERDEPRNNFENWTPRIFEDRRGRSGGLAVGFYLPGRFEAFAAIACRFRSGITERLDAESLPTTP